jgi:hypothetical protein
MYFTPFIHLDLTFAINVSSNLPAFMGPAWSAVLRRGLKRYVSPDLAQAEVGVLVVPGLLDQKTMTLPLGLVFPVILARHMLELLWDINELGGDGYLRPGDNIHLQIVRCANNSLTVAEFMGKDRAWHLDLIRPVTPEDLQPHIKTLLDLPSLTLRFVTPLRLTRPPGAKDPNHRYCDADYFTSWEGRRPLSRLAGRVRYLDPEYALPGENEEGPVVAECDLAWRDITYGRGFAKTIGGVTGTLRLQGRIPPSLALPLALGQHTGAGKNGSFGLGFYKILEL